MLSSSSSRSSVPLGGESRAALAPGTWLGKHQLLHRLAVGGMAEIYLARATGIEQFEKLLVLKRMLPQHAGDHRFIQRFLDEARLAATLSHPNIAHVYDIGGGDGHYYFTMEYVHGQDLAAVLHASRAAGQPVPLAHALTIVAGVAAGLHAAHEKRDDAGALLGVVHRDVSPSNVLVGYDGGVKIVDFGIAKLAAQDGKTRTGGFVGKARYSSPEHVQGQALDRRSDLFSLGIVLFELSCGRRPFDGDADFAVMQAIVHGEPPRPRDLVPGYPPALEDIVMRALRRDRDARFATAQELQLAIEDVARHAQIALSSVALSAYMGELFEGNVAAWRDARRAGRSLGDHVVATATGGTVDLAALDPAAPAAPVREPPRRSQRRRILALAGAAAIAVIARAAWPVADADDRTAAPSVEAGAVAPAPRIEAAAPVAPAPRIEATAAAMPPRADHDAHGPTQNAASARVDAVAPEPRPATAPPRPRAADVKRAASHRARATRATPPAAPAERAQPWNPDSPLEP